MRRPPAGGREGAMIWVAPTSGLSEGPPDLRETWRHGEESTMRNEPVAPATRGVAGEVRATVDLAGDE